MKIHKMDSKNTDVRTSTIAFAPFTGLHRNLLANPLLLLALLCEHSNWQLLVSIFCMWYLRAPLCPMWTGPILSLWSQTCSSSMSAASSSSDTSASSTQAAGSFFACNVEHVTSHFCAQCGFQKVHVKSLTQSKGRAGCRFRILFGNYDTSGVVGGGEHVLSLGREWGLSFTKTMPTTLFGALLARPKESPTRSERQIVCTNAGC